MESQIVINNQLVSYLKSGSENAEQSLVFLHGWRSQKEVWQQVIKDLGFKIQDNNYYAIDLPGFGKSPAPANAWTVGDYTETIKAFIEKLNLKNVVLIGHSFGSRVGIKLAAKYPDLVSKLILVDSAGFAMDVQKKSAINFVAKIARPFFKPKFMQGLRQKIYQGIGAEDYLATPQLQKTFINITNEDLTEDMGNITTPTLIIWGENDQETPVEMGKKMHSLIHNSKFMILNHAGHFSFLDQPEEFVHHLLVFLND